MVVVVVIFFSMQSLLNLNKSACVHVRWACLLSVFQRFTGQFFVCIFYSLIPCLCIAVEGVQMTECVCDYSIFLFSFQMKCNAEETKKKQIEKYIHAASPFACTYKMEIVVVQSDRRAKLHHVGINKIIANGREYKKEHQQHHLICASFGIRNYLYDDDDDNVYQF